VVKGGRKGENNTLFLRICGDSEGYGGLKEDLKHKKALLVRAGKFGGTEGSFYPYSAKIILSNYEVISVS